MTRHSPIVKKYISPNANFDLTFPLEGNIETKLFNLGFILHTTAAIRFPGKTCLDALFFEKFHNGFNYQIIVRHPENYYIFVTIWNKISPDFYITNLWENNPNFIGLDLDEFAIKKLISAQINAMYEMEL